MSRGPTGFGSCPCDVSYNTRNSVDLPTLFSPNFPDNPLRIQGFDIITLTHDDVLGGDLLT